MNEPIFIKRPRGGKNLAWLFVFASVFGLGLAVFISNSSQEVLRVSNPLIKEKIPLLADLSQLERSLLIMQNNQYQYFAYSINRKAFLEKRERYQKIFQDSLKNLNKALPEYDTSFKMIQMVGDNSVRLSPKLDKILNSTPIDWDEARAVLVEMSIDTGEITQALSYIRESIEQAVYEAGRSTEERVSRIPKLVVLYSMIILLISLLVAYHIHARTRAEEELAYNATHDPITGKFNRLALEDQINQWNHDQDTQMLTIASINRFERLVSTLGHEVADQALSVIAEHLLSQTRLLETQIFRLDGGNFALLYPSLKGTLRTDIEMILDSLKQPLVVNQYELLISITCGSARFPVDGSDAVTLIRNANMALEHAKRMNVRFVGYAATLDLQTTQKLALETALGYAVSNHELMLYYQPQMDLKTKKILGFEALVRWKHNGKIISPMEFIPVAEESGLIVSIGEWILREACQQAVNWKKAGFSDLIIAVNISARQFQDPRFLEVATLALKDSGATPAMIELEITESTIMNNPEHVVAELQNLRKMGFTLAIDDFGTGYSSLAYLKRFPIHKLKIDKSFIDPLVNTSSNQEHAIVHAIVQMGQNLGLRVIAEGVETQAQVTQLERLSCDEIQGYWLSKPLPLSEVQNFLTQYKPTQAPET